MNRESSIPELVSLSARDVQSLLLKGEVSPLDLLDVLEARILEIDGKINALPTLCFERARKMAKVINPAESILGGLPVAIKDLKDVSGVRTTYGSGIYRDNVPDRSDILVEHIEENGGVVYAKSNTPEFGTGANTYNYVLGETRNPWNTDMSVAGSSGGAAAALASGTAWLAQGSDMGGSLRNPASFCGIVGMRPTVGRVATDLGSSVTNTLSTCGPMARNVADLALLFDAMCGHEPSVPLSLPAPMTPFFDAARSPHLPGKIAFSMDLGITPVDPEVRVVVSRAVDSLSDAGYQIIEANPDFSGLHEIFHVLRAHDYAAGLGTLLAKHEDELNPNVAWNIREGLKLTVEDINQAEAARVALVSRVQAFFSEYPVLLSPATIVPPYPVSQDHVAQCDGHQFDNYYQWLAIAYAFTTALCPALSLPCGFTRNRLPVGLQIAAATQADATVIAAAAEIEQILDLDMSIPINPRPPGGTGSEK